MPEIEKVKNIKELEKLALEVLKLKQERELRRPLLIEFCGSPKSGKSTTITALNIFLKRNEFKTVVLTERASVCPIKNKTHPFFNIWTLSSAIAETVQHIDQGKDKVDIIISDRGIFDALCWFKWLNENPSFESPYLNDSNYDILKNFCTLDIWRDYLDLIYVFKVKPEISIEREYANLLTEKRGSIMTESVLRGFNKSIDDIVATHKENFRNITTIFTDETKYNSNPNNVNYEVTIKVLENLKELLIEKIGYLKGINKTDLNISDISSISLQNAKLDFENREIIEKSNYIQPIAIAVITNSKRDRVLVVKKSTKRTTHDSPEMDKLLLYIGGHVRKEDKIDGISFFKIIEKTLHREIQEEIGESLSIKNQTPLIIYTPNTKKSEKHLAICYIIEIDLDDKKFKLKSDEFIMKTGKSKSGQILKIDEIVAGKYKLEAWSISILKQIFNREVEKEKGLF